MISIMARDSHTRAELKFLCFACEILTTCVYVVCEDSQPSIIFCCDEQGKVQLPLASELHKKLIGRRRSVHAHFDWKDR